MPAMYGPPSSLGKKPKGSMYQGGGLMQGGGNQSAVNTIGSIGMPGGGGATTPSPGAPPGGFFPSSRPSGGSLIGLAGGAGGATVPGGVPPGGGSTSVTQPPITQPPPGLSEGISQMQELATGFLDPNSAYFQELMTNMREGIGKGSAAKSRAAALRGVQSGASAGETMRTQEGIQRGGVEAMGRAGADLSLAAPRMGMQALQSTFGPQVGMYGIQEGGRQADVGSALSSQGMGMQNQYQQQQLQLQQQQMLMDLLRGGYGG